MNDIWTAVEALLDSWFIVLVIVIIAVAVIVVACVENTICNYCNYDGDPCPLCGGNDKYASMKKEND